MASLTWAVGVIAFTPLSKHHPAYIINFHRILVALPVFFVILLARGDFLSSFARLQSTEVVWAAIAVLASYAFGDVLFLMATRRLGAPAALAIGSVYPVFSALAGLFLHHEALAFTKYLGISIVIVGTIFVILSGARGRKPPVSIVPRVHNTPHVRHRWRSDHRTGVLLAFGCSLCWALNTVAVSEAGRTLDAVMVNMVRMAIAIVLCPLIGIGMNGSKSFRMIGWKRFLPVFPYFAVESALGPLCYVYGLSHAPLAMGSALTSLAPVISVPLALALHQEKFSWTRTLGVCSVVAGICVMVL